jgi:hypothetical protein
VRIHLEGKGKERREGGTREKVRREGRKRGKGEEG